jgi:FlaA1/EpsC-like NDP-sugar epimerase
LLAVQLAGQKGRSETRFTGLRPGETLFEELSLGTEETLKTKRPCIFIGEVKAPSLMWIGDRIDDLGELAAGSEGSGIQAQLKEIVPGYQTTVVRSDDVAAPVALNGPHEHRAPACPS